MKTTAAFLLLFSLLAKSQTDQVPFVQVRLIDGTRTTVHELLKEGPLLVDFWALWCAPCLKAMPHLDSYHRKFSERGFNVLAINLDTQRSLSKVRSYIRSQGYGFLVAVDPAQESFQQLNGSSLPYTLLIDSSGKIVQRRMGYVPGDERAIQEQIVDLLAGKSDESPSASQ
ncbi:MAG: TlpA family protein disulfide reductase [Fidelibacterota bacterium]